MERATGLAGWSLECCSTEGAVKFRQRESRVSGIIRLRPCLALVPECRCWNCPVSSQTLLVTLPIGVPPKSA